MSCDDSRLIYKHWVCGFFIKPIIIIFISINIHRPYKCDPLGPYISLVNNFIDPITPYCSTLIYYLHQHIDLLIKDQLNLIDRLSCQPIECHATSYTLGDMKNIRTPLCGLTVDDLEYDQLSNPNQALKLVMMHVENRREILWYFYYLGQWFH